jgi:hypothetical protein
MLFLMPRMQNGKATHSIRLFDEIRSIRFDSISVKNIFVVIAKSVQILILKINKVMASLAKLLTCVRKPK